MTTFAINDCFFWGQYSTFVRKLTKTLYCPKKTNPFLQKCCTVPKNQKKTIFSGPGTSQGNKTGKDWFFWFFLGQYSTFAKKDWFFLGQYSTFARKLTKTLYRHKKTNLFLLKCCTVPKKPKKNQSFQVLGPRRATRLGKDWFFWFFLDSTALLQKKIGFFGTVQHFCKKINKNTVLSQKNLSFFVKVLYCLKKTNLIDRQIALRGPRT